MSHQATPVELSERLAAERRGAPFLLYRDEKGEQQIVELADGACRPFKGGHHDATPATNPQIAEELFLSVAAVKTHLRALCRAFDIDRLPQQEKRRRLVTLAFATGAVRDRDL